MKSSQLQWMLTGILMIITIRLSAQSWTEVSKVVASDREYTAWFGRAVSISGHTAIVGAYLKDNENADQNFLLDEGAAYIYEKDPSGYWIQVQKITASDKDEFDWFGSSVGISGNYAIVGAYVEDEDENGENTMQGAGSAYIFEKNESGTWEEVQTIVPSNRFNFDYFGFSSSISGNYAILGATLKDQTGVAYIFERDEQGIWNEVQKINGDFIYGGEFGYSVCINGDYVIIGAPYEREEDDQGMLVNWNVGAAYIFQRNGSGIWNRVFKLLAPHREADDLYGISVGMSGDHVIVGSNWEDEDAQGIDSLSNAGAVYLYENDGSNNWDLVQKIVPPDRKEGDEFGFSVSISGEMAVVGSPRKHYYVGEVEYHLAGTTYMYRRNSSGEWEEFSKLIASDYNSHDQFGIAVGLSDNYAIVGAYYEMDDASGENPLIQAGSAYVFSFCGTVENNLAESICLGDSLFLGGDYRSISGTYYDTLRASTGCDSVIVTDLTVIEVDTMVTLSGSTLTASATDADYQWIDCNTQEIIPGETNKNFRPDETGNFAVEITQDGCIDTSFCHSVTVVGIPENTFGSEFEIYPNPNNGILLINTGNIYEDLEIRVLNLAGKQVLDRKYVNQQFIELRLEKLLNGLYFIQIKTTEKQAFLKVLKE